MIMAVQGISREPADVSREDRYDAAARQRQISKAGAQEKQASVSNGAAENARQKKMAAESAFRSSSEKAAHRSMKSKRQDQIAEAGQKDRLERQRENADLVTERYEEEWKKYDETTERILELEVFSKRISEKERSARQRERDQEHADEMLKRVSQAAEETRFDTRRPVEASMADEERTRNPRGTSQKLILENETLKNLGLEDYSVEGEPDLEQVERALERVEEAKEDAEDNTQRNAYTAQTAQKNTEQFIAQTVGRTEDMDVVKNMSDKQKTEVYNDYAKMVVKAKEYETQKTVMELVNP